MENLGKDVLDQHPKRRSPVSTTHSLSVSVYLFASLVCLGCQVSPVSGRGRFMGTLANYSGDIVIGGLFPIHNYNHESRKCGNIQAQDGIQVIEAMMFSLDEINSSDFLPGFTLGALIADTCDSAAVALERSVEFVRDLTDTFMFPGQFAFQCADGSTPVKTGTGYLDRVVGVVGAAASSVSTQIANFLRLFKVPQVSYLSTTPDLSIKERYGYFLRTVPSDTYQAMAIIQILSGFEWKYVSVVYDDSTYGSELYNEIATLTKIHGICFAVVRKIRRYPSSPTDDLDLEMEQVVTDLTLNKKAKVVLVISNNIQARKLFSAASKNKEAHGLIWVGSDGWSARESVVKGLEHVAENAITVQPLAVELQQFDQYFTRLKPTANTRNPWFKEFWASHFNCYWPDSPAEWRQTHTELCDEGKRPSTKNGYRQFPALNFVRNAVQVYAHALKNMHHDKCGTTPGLCPRMALSEITGQELLAYMKNVTFPEKTYLNLIGQGINIRYMDPTHHHIGVTGVYPMWPGFYVARVLCGPGVCMLRLVINVPDGNGGTFAFINEVDGPPLYSILNYRHFRDGYRWKEIGKYIYENGHGMITPAGLVNSIKSEYPTSVCHRDCEIYEAKKTVEKDKCCWVCVNCSTYQFLPTESECQDCPLGQVPNSHFNACLAIDEVFMKHGQPISIGLSSFSVAGIVVCLIIGAIFFKYRNTPVIKASGIELSYVLLGGVALSYAATLAFVDEPSPVSCAFTRFLFGLCYTVCYAAILIKTNRIARIFHGGEKGAVKTKYTNPKSQLVFLLALTFIELVILIVWTVIKTPTIGHLYPTRAENIRICSESDDASYLIGLIYPFLLVVLCTVYAVKTRKTPDGFNEARFIAFCAYSTCILWLSFVPIYFTSSGHALRIVTLSLSVSLNATVILVCLFLPKVYIVILRPYKNTREAVMARTATMRSSEEHSGSKNVHSNHNDHNPSGSPGKQEVIGISVISGQPLHDGMDVNNPSTDSGCYINPGFRDSRTFVDEGIGVENVESANGIITSADITQSDVASADVSSADVEVEMTESAKQMVYYCENDYENISKEDNGDVENKEERTETNN